MRVQSLDEIVGCSSALPPALAGVALAQGGPGRMMEERGGGMGWGMWGNDGPGWGMGGHVGPRSRGAGAARTGCSTASRGGWPS